MKSFLLVATLSGLGPILTVSASRLPRQSPRDEACSIYKISHAEDCQGFPTSFLVTSSEPPVALLADTQILEDAFAACAVLQDEYFNSDYGTWPSAIDWTAAVVGTHLSAMLTTLTESLGSISLQGVADWAVKENLISSLYAQVVSFFFGQDSLAIRGQAYDDILWVVLGWIETIKFVETHERLHSPKQSNRTREYSGGLREALATSPWHGYQWLRLFAHRARVFWDLGSRGWETHFCHGGMIWNPRLRPYKNAITNELWIASSIAMYRHFPGDNFTAPWPATQSFRDKNPAHLAAAVEGYKWLKNIGLLNEQGLFADGFHIDFRKPGNIDCDLRDEMVYTYNQGVLLTGQRGLWAVTGSASYLEEGHKLVQAVIHATGWSLARQAPIDDIMQRNINELPPWRGLGRGGIVEDQCDAKGLCSQDGQIFKGIYFHHFTTFCAPLEPLDGEGHVAFDRKAFQHIRKAHNKACQSYIGWVRHNALAALQTRDKRGRFGMWWGASLFGGVMSLADEDGVYPDADNTTDYRNFGTPQDDLWGRKVRWLPGCKDCQDTRNRRDDQPLLNYGVPHSPSDQQRLVNDDTASGHAEKAGGKAETDPNARGRGRTVETQAGGLALLRAYWELSQQARSE